MSAPFSGFVFKIQAGMDRAHRDRLAFVRVCSGRFTRGMVVTHADTGRPFATKYAQSVFGRDRSTLDEAFPGDVIGLVNANALRVGDTLFADEKVAFPRIPLFAPEHFAVARAAVTGKQKQFRRGIEQLGEEGVVQVLTSDRRGAQAPVLAAVGPMQFDVAKHRMEHEFGSAIRLEPLGYSVARAVAADAIPIVEQPFRRRGADARGRAATSRSSPTSGASPRSSATCPPAPSRRSSADAVSRRFEEIDWQQTPWGEISLRRRLEPSLLVDVYEVKLGEEFLMSSLFTVAEIELARLGLAAVEGEHLDVVVGGLGLGYTAPAALEDERVRTVTVVEALGPVISWHQRQLLPDTASLTARPAHHPARGRLLRAGPRGRRASVVRPASCTPCCSTSTTPPTTCCTPATPTFYTREGLERLAARLHPGGVFALWSDDPPEAAFTALLASVFADAAAHEVTFANPLTGGTVVQHRLRRDHGQHQPGRRTRHTPVVMLWCRRRGSALPGGADVLR